MLYSHYLYRMGVLPKRRNNTKGLPFILREDVRLLDKRIRMNNYLHNHGIETIEQLHAREAALRVQIAPLLAERKRLYKAAGAMERIGQINAELKPIWAEIYLCRDIWKHSEDIRKKLDAVDEISRQKQRERTAMLRHYLSK